MFCEISYGPYSYDKAHYLEDGARLGKFAKDSYNYDHLFTQKFKRT